jgi:translation initiation factor 2 beta subunit (eIF-2beta)/eIF-5
MIDTDKYEGHTPVEEWGDIVYAAGYVPILLDTNVYSTDLDRRLMTDAPLLLEEVRRLRSYIAHHDGDAYRQCPECGSLDFTFKFDHEGMHCDCNACDNEWKVKIE